MDYGCIGEKLGHSFSKIIHNELADYDYELLEISPQDLPGFMQKADFKAINVTIPYKKAVIPYLYKIDGIAKKIGAVNTIVNRNGRLYGYNTDFFGMSDLINRENISLSGKKVLILGSGGTSETAFAVAESMNAAEVLRVSRRKTPGLITYEEAYSRYADAEIIINTTPCGMYPNIDGEAVDIIRFPKLCGVIDAVYNPINSSLVVSAKENSVKAAGGLYMLISQAAFAVEKFIGAEVKAAEVDRIYKKILKDKKNAVLIGMPSCGKTTIGKSLSESLSKEFIDTDEEIIKAINMSISDFFDKYGESAFREIESEVIAKISPKQNCVIATGGGAVLNSKNIHLLKENGTVIFIDRPLEQLISTDDRPLSSSRELLKKRYNERYDRYVSACDVRINAEYDLETNIKKAEEGFLNEVFGVERT